MGKLIRREKKEERVRQKKTSKVNGGKSPLKVKLSIFAVKVLLKEKEEV